MDSATVLIVFGVVVVGLYLWYAGIISKRNKALEALSGIDVQLKKRLNLIPNILTIAKKFMEHESTLLTEVPSSAPSQIKATIPKTPGR